MSLTTECALNVIIIYSIGILHRFESAPRITERLYAIVHSRIYTSLIFRQTCKDHIVQ